MKVLEFYSGLGGLHYAISACVPDADVTAFDVNDLANDVYEHNFGRRPVQTNVSTLTAKRLDKWAADAWLLSPPCQPYTRRGLKKQSADARAGSFLSVLDLLPELQHPPRYLLVENVVGFESSDTRDVLAQTLAAAGYQLQEFIVTPLQLGIPYSRPRYFALAKHGGAFALPSPAEGAGPLRQPPSRLLAALAAVHGQQAEQPKRSADGQQEQPSIAIADSLEAGAAAAAAAAAGVRPLGEFLVPSPAPELAGGVKAKLPNFVGWKRAAATNGYEVSPEEQQDAASAGAGASSDGGSGPAADAQSSRWPAGAAGGQQPDNSGAAQQQNGAAAAAAGGQPGQYPAVQSEKQEERDPWAAFRVPEEVARKHGYCFDLVSAQSTTSNCFTKTYGQYIKGSGSLIATRNLDVLRQLEEAEAQRAQRGDASREMGGNAEGEEKEEESQPAACRQEPEQQEQPRPQPGTEQEQQAGPLAGGGGGDGAGGGAAPGRSRPAEQGAAESASALFGALSQLGLRYFTPREIANLHSFPPSFSFPPSVTLRQRYSLLGNSLSVAVVADLLEYLFTEPEGQP